MWCVISGYGDADFSLSSSQVGDMVSGSWGGVWTTGGEVSGWLTNGTFPCGVAPLEKVCPWKVASGMVGREDPPLFVRKNFKSWMIECLSLHFCTGRNLLRNFLFCKELQPDPSRQTTYCTSLAAFQGMNSSMILDVNMILYREWWQSPIVMGPSWISLYMTVT